MVCAMVCALVRESDTRCTRFGPATQRNDRHAGLLVPERQGIECRIQIELRDHGRRGVERECDFHRSAVALTIGGSNDERRRTIRKRRTLDLLEARSIQDERAIGPQIGKDVEARHSPEAGTQLRYAARIGGAPGHRRIKSNRIAMRPAGVIGEHRS